MMATFRQKYLRVSLRTLLLGITALCVWLGILGAAARREQRVVATLHKAGGSIHYDYEMVSGANSPDVRLMVDVNAVPSGPRWLREMIGEEWFTDVAAVTFDGCTLSESEFAELGDLHSVRSLFIRDTKIRSSNSDHVRSINDSDLQVLDRLANLQLVTLRNVDVHGEGLTYLARSIGLRSLNVIDSPLNDSAFASFKPPLMSLNLSGTKISDAALRDIASLPNLKKLNLVNTHVGDVGLWHLQNCTALERLTIALTDVTNDGVQKLQALLPSCKIMSTTIASH
jgi:hypothetical protein